MPTPSRRRTDRKTETGTNVTPFPIPATDQMTGPIEPAESDIARRAFEIYCGRGYQPGHELEDWLQAEGELRAALAAQAISPPAPRRRRASADA